MELNHLSWIKHQDMPCILFEKTCQKDEKTQDMSSPPSPPKLPLDYGILEYKNLNVIESSKNYPLCQQHYVETCFGVLK